MRDNILNWNLLINGLKYLAEHQDLSYEEMKEEINSLGWTMGIQDVARKIPKFNAITGVEMGIRYGDYFTGANILANAIAQPANYQFVKDNFLKKDNAISVYEYIRMVTKDPNYTLESIQNNESKKL